MFAQNLRDLMYRQEKVIIMDALQRLDTEMMISLKELLAENFDLLVNTFVSDGNERMGRLCEAIKNNDFKVVRMEAHALKGSSRNIGADGFAKLCAEVENQARDNDGRGLNTKFLSIETEFNLLCVEVKTFL